jgi:hypothetical protein
VSADARWVRLNVDWDGSEWLAALPWHVRAAWPVILCYIKREGRDGKAKTPILSRLAGGHDIPLEVITALSNAAIENGALIVADGHWIIAKWDVYQKPDATNADRQKRYKERQSASNRNNNAVENADNAAITPLPCHVTETETVGDSSLRSESRGTSAGTRRGEPRMVRPTDVEVATYFRERGGTGSWAREYWAYYTSNGWKVGRSAMKDWKAAADGWILREQKKVEQARTRAPTARMPSTHSTRDTLNALMEGSEIYKQQQQQAA